MKPLELNSVAAPGPPVLLSFSELQNTKRLEKQQQQRRSLENRESRRAQRRHSLPGSGGKSTQVSGKSEFSKANSTLFNEPKKEETVIEEEGKSGDKEAALKQEGKNVNRPIHDIRYKPRLDGDSASGKSQLGELSGWKKRRLPTTCVSNSDRLPPVGQHETKRRRITENTTSGGETKCAWVRAISSGGSQEDKGLQ